jgi:ElaB/YqjD/DUF883 family membrane-anchored ribosome-binding protein
MAQTLVSNDVSSSTSDRLASMAHEAIDRATPRVSRAEQEVRGAATKAADSAKLLQEHAMQAAEENLRSVRSFIGSNPLAAAGIAFAAGALLSALVRR